MKNTIGGRVASLLLLSIMIALLVIYIADRQFSVQLSPFGKRTLSKGVYAFDISPDGKQVAAANGEGLSIISLATGRLDSRIAVPGAASDNSVLGCFVVWSPAGDRIAIVRKMSRGRSQLLLASVIGPHCAIVAESSGIARPAWSPDGKRLAWFEESQKREPVQLSSLPGAGPVQMPVSELRVALAPDLTKSRVIFRGMLSSLQWTSPDTIAFGQPQNRIVFIRPDTQETWCIEHEWNGPSHGAHTIGSWEVSPSSGDLAYGFDGKVWIRRVSLGAEQVSIADWQPLELEWAPDGDSLLFVTTDPKAEHQDAPIGSFPFDPPHLLHRIAEAGTDHRTLFSERDGISNLRCTRDGQILYLSGGNLCARDLR